MIRWFEEHNLVSWIITIFVAVLIYYFSSISYDLLLGQGRVTKGILSVFYHFFAFFFFGAFLIISCVQGRRKGFFWFAVFLAVFYGVLDEFHQYFVLGRFFSIEDMFIDACGVFLSALIYARLRFG